MTDTSSDIRLQNGRRLTMILILLTILFCVAATAGAYQSIALFQQEKTAQKAHQDKIEAVMLIQSSVIDLQGFVLGGDNRLTSRLSEKASQFESLMRSHPGDQDFQRMSDAFHMWHQKLAQPMLQKRHEFDTSSLNFSEMGIAYIQGNAPMHERRLEELSSQALSTARDSLEASQGRINGILMPAITITIALGAASLVVTLLLLKGLARPTP